MNTLFPYILPVLIGLVFFSISPTLLRIAFQTTERSKLSGYLFRYYLKYGCFISSFSLLSAQLVLIRRFEYASITAELCLLIFLAAIGLSAKICTNDSKGGCIAVLSLIGMFILYWILEKYLVHTEAFASWMLISSGIDTDLKLLIIPGISYIGFKLIHFVVDLCEGEFERVNPIEFISWILFFPSLVAGPMMRYQDWEKQRSELRLTLETAVEGLQRIVFGLFMKLAIADVISEGTIAHIPNLQEASFQEISLGCMMYTVYLFFDFAGYSHIAIGVGLFFGIRLPENFDKPYLARNIAEFWTRWHISLSNILRDYIFYPISIAIKRSYFFKKMNFLGLVLPPFVTFVIAGIWHGLGLNFLVFGALHGIGLGFIALLKQSKCKGPFAIWWSCSLFGRLGGIALTFCFVSFTFLFFALPWSQLMIIFNRLNQ